MQDASCWECPPDSTIQSVADAIMREQLHRHNSMHLPFDKDAAARGRARAAQVNRERHKAAR